MALSVSAEERPVQSWWPAALLAAVIYPAVGIGFAFLDTSPGPFRIRIWRLAAWVASALVFAAHLVYEQARHSSALQTASRLSIAVAVGAFLLAVWVLAYGSVTGAPRSSLAPFALILFPLFTGVPAFAIALVVAGVASKLRRGL